MAELYVKLSNPSIIRGKSYGRNINLIPRADKKTDKNITPPADGGEALRSFKPIELGGEDDTQFQQALNILKAIDIHQKN